MAPNFPARDYLRNAARRFPNSTKFNEAGPSEFPLDQLSRASLSSARTNDGFAGPGLNPPSDIRMMSMFISLGDLLEDYVPRLKTTLEDLERDYSALVNGLLDAQLKGRARDMQHKATYSKMGAEIVRFPF
jgi:hypothetical protein